MFEIKVAGLNNIYILCYGEMLYTKGFFSVRNLIKLSFL
jgi:hypothetical protein